LLSQRIGYVALEQRLQPLLIVGWESPDFTEGVCAGIPGLLEFLQSWVAIGLSIPEELLVLGNYQSGAIHVGSGKLYMQ